VTSDPIAAFLASVIAHVRELRRDEPTPRGRNTVVFTDQGHHAEHLDVERWDVLVWDAFGRFNLTDLPEANEAAATIWSMGGFHGWSVIIKSDIPADAFRPWAVHALMPVLIDYLNQVGSLELDPDLLGNTVRRHITSWQTPLRVDELIVPLFGLEMDVEELHIDEHTTITRFSKAEKGALWHPWEAEMGTTNIFAFGGSEFCLRLHSTEPRARLNSSASDILARAAAVLTALRLLKEGEVFAGGAFICALPPVIDRPRGTYTLVEFRHGGMRIGARYQLNAMDFDPLRALHANVRSVKAGSHVGLALALRRFVLADSREWAEDRIIDLAIALEACLLHPEKDELAYRFVLRGAKALTAHGDAENAASLLKSLYAARSQIVHGGRSIEDLERRQKLDGLTTHAFLQKTRRVARRILREYLSRAVLEPDLAKINKGLDDEILGAVTTN
jgi:hypothetical protein